MKFHAHHRMMLFVILSLLVHMVWLISSQTYSINVPIQDDSQIAIQIIKNPQSKLKKEIQAISKLQHNAAAENKKQQNTSETRSKNNQVAKAKLLGQLRKNIQHYFTYPALAQQRGWQGKVIIGFEVNSMGNIHKFHIKQSSGYDILDNSALNTLNLIGQLDVKSRELNGQLLEIPVIYQLEG
ncbi:MAG: TonB family protein [Gammaproteobacteria bacterium]|nr:TonB family protein [Gammaproteobacteria bacterium]